MPDATVTARPTDPSEPSGAAAPPPGPAPIPAPAILQPPAPARAARLRALASIVVLFLAGGAFGAGVARLAAQSEWLRSTLGVLGPWDLLLVPVLLLLVIGVHELGHLAGALSRGMRFVLLIVGPLRWTRSSRGIEFDWFWSPATFGGLAAAIPDPSRPMPPQFARLIVGGPLASLVLTGVALALAWLTDGRPAAYALLVAALSAAIVLATAIPFRGGRGSFMSDGAQLLELRRGGAAVARRMELTTLMAQSLAGTRPRDLDAATIARLSGDDGGNPMLRVAGHLYAYGHALDEGRIGDAAGWIDRVAGAIDAFPAGFRQALALEIAYFRARHQGDLAQARHWLALGHGGVVEPGRREAAAAAIALLEGDAARAAAQARAGLATLARASDAGGAVASADQLRELERLAQGAAPDAAIAA
jgi:hypothetical protein